MEKIFFFLLLLLCAMCVFGGPLPADYKLLGDATWVRTTPSSQFPPRGAVSGNGERHDIGPNPPALYWGNSFTIKNIRPQNDSNSPGRKRLNPLVHFAIQNQSIAMIGQEYLIRPRGYVAYDSAKRFSCSSGPCVDQESPNGEFLPPGISYYAAQALNITPDWAAYRLTNSSTASIAFFESDLLNPDGPSFQVWASNPSAVGWFGPGSITHNVSDPTQASANEVPVATVDIEWLVACRWIANGTDCGHEMPSGEVCSLTEFGLCWSRFAAPDYEVEQVLGGQTVFADLRDPSDSSRADNWGIILDTRPLFISAPAYEDYDFRAFAGRTVSTGGGNCVAEVLANKDTQAFVVGLPLNSVSVSADETREIEIEGSTTNEWLRCFMPGKDNNGGALEISVRTIIEVPDTANFPNQISRAVSHIHMVPSKVVITRDQPTASFYFSNITKPLGVSMYVVHFLVSETSPSTTTIANSSAAFGDLSGIYPNGAYSIPTVTLHPQTYHFRLRNFPPATSESVISLPIAPEALFNCTAASGFVAQLDTSAVSIGQETISFPFTVTPPGALKFWTCPSPSSKRQSTPTEIASFTFIGSSDAVVFFITTQATPISGVLLEFGNPVVSNGAVFDPLANLLFDQNDTYVFDITQNEVQLAITNDAGGTADQTGGPYVGQDFYMQFTWTPPVRNGFGIAITGLYMTFPSSAAVSNNNTSATFTVPSDSTGFLAGPFRAQSPSNIAAGTENFTIAYSVSLVPLGSGSSDHSWYRLSSALQLVTVSRHRFAIINWDSSANIQLLSTGQKSPVLCLAPSFNGALGPTDEVWVSVVSDVVLDSGSWLIVDPIVAATDAHPSNSLLLTAANPVACFTARFDTNWQFLDSLTDRAFDQLESSLTIVLAGASATSFQSAGLSNNIPVLNMPTFLVYKPSISWELSTSAFGLAAGSFAAGETALLWITVEVAPPSAFSYNITLPGAKISPLSVEAGRFSHNGSQQHLWQIAFEVLPVSEVLRNHGGQRAQDLWTSQLVLVASGGDAVFYAAPASQPVTVVARLIGMSVFLDDVQNIQVDDTIIFGRVSLHQEVVHGLTATPFLRSAGTSSSLLFTPPSFTFTPNGINSIDFAVTGKLLGTYEFGISLNGPDQYIFRWAEAPTNLYSLVVQQRAAPALGTVPEDMVASVRYGPISVGVPTPALPGEDVIVTVDFGSDFDLSKAAFNAADGSLQYFDVAWMPHAPLPSDDLGNSGTVQVSVQLSGADAWKYEQPQGISIDLKLAFVSISFATDEAHIIGMRYSGFVELDYPAPEGLRLLLYSTSVQFYETGAATPSNSAIAPYIISFVGPADGLKKHFEYVVNTPITTYQEFSTPELVGALVQPVLDATFGGNRFFSLHSQSSGISIPSGYRSFGFEKTKRIGEEIVNPLTSNDNSDPSQVFMVNRESPLYTVLVTSPPENSVTLTISHPNLVFNGGQAEAVLQFTRGKLTAPFSFMPVSLPASTTLLDQLNVAVSGPDAALYTAFPIWQTLKRFQIIPELGFSPIPALYTDGSVEDVRVWLVDALAQGFSYNPNAAFTLQVKASLASVLIEPSMLHFSPSALVNNRLSQSFALRHLRTSTIKAATTYSLSWTLWMGGLTADDSRIVLSLPVPASAAQIVLMRYQVITEFPKKLSFGWQEASINITRPPLAHISLVPHGPAYDGIASGATYGGSHTAGGRLVFDPPSVVFAPGQQVSTFKVKAIAGSDQNAVYYRVDWEMVGQEDDLYNYLDYAQNPSPKTRQFSTWHAATGSAASLGFLLLILTVILALTL